MNKFNIRVYGLLVNNNNEILITDEEIKGFRFTKFPGGGLEFGEGLIDALKREFIEECNLEIEIVKHFYTTDFFVKSLFHDEQLISVYYLVKAKSPIEFKVSSIPFDYDDQENIDKQSFRIKSIQDISESELNFPVDKHVLELLKKEFI